MASGLYDNYVEAIQGGGSHGQVDLLSDTIKGAIVSGDDYAENLVSDQDYNDTGYLINVCYNSEATQTLGTKTIGTAGARIFTSAAFTFTAVAQDAAKVVDALLVYKDSTVITTSPLIAFWDGFSAVVPNTSDIIVTPNVGGLWAL